MSIFRNACILAFSTVQAVLFTSRAFAAYSNVTEMSEGWIDGIKSLSQMGMYAIFALGLLVFGYGLYSLAMPNSRMESNKGRAIMCLVIGAIMMSATGGVNMLSGTLTGDSASGLGELGVN